MTFWLEPKTFGPTVIRIILVRILPNQQIKFELFLGKIADQVYGLTSNAIIYER